MVTVLNGSLYVRKLKSHITCIHFSPLPFTCNILEIADLIVSFFWEFLQQENLLKKIEGHELTKLKRLNTRIREMVVIKCEKRENEWWRSLAVCLSWLYWFFSLSQKNPKKKPCSWELTFILIQNDCITDKHVGGQKMRKRESLGSQMDQTGMRLSVCLSAPIFDVWMVGSVLLLYCPHSTG